MREIILILSVLLSVSLFAQQEPLFTQYYNNDMAINPAVSGSKTYNSLSMQTRQQWLGFEGAPLSTNINYHGALNNRSAMGGYLMFDKANPSLQANLQLNYAYHIPLNYNKVNLSFGVGAKLMYYNLDFKNDNSTVLLITGGCGFIGSNFINLIMQNYDKINLINICVCMRVH